MKSRVAGLTTIVLLAASFAGAQEQRGLITGTVFDTQGAVVPGAAVTVTDEGTGAVYNGKTTGEGTFTIPGLPFGSYSVEIVASGFRKWTTTKVQVVTAQEANVKATLQVGASSETVTVEAAQQIVETTSTELATHLDRKQIFDLPSTTRNPLDFATQMAGVTSTGSATSGGSVMNGLRGSSNNLTQDGIDIRDSFIKTSGFANNSGYNVNLESIGEFSISGQNIGADSGAGVAQVRMITARGTNVPHGSLFYFGRNDFLNANSWTNNRLGNPRATSHQHRFGGSIGAPVEIPKIYNGRNRTFFFFEYSGFREHLQSIDDNQVYSQNARNGIFQYQDANGNIQSVNLLALSSRHLGLNSFTQQLLNATPLPNPGAAGYTVNTQNGDGLNTIGVRFKVPGSDPDNQYDMRIDHKIAESARWGTHWLDGEWHWERGVTTPGDDPIFPKSISPGCFGAVCDSQSTTTTKGGLFSMGLNSTLSPTVFNEFRLGFNRPQITFLPPQPFARSFKVIMHLTSSTGNTNPEDNFDPQGRLSPFYTIQDNFTKLKGTHTLKTGFQVIWESVHRFNDFANLSGINGGVIPQVQFGTSGNNDNGLNNCSAFPNLPKGGTGTTICNNAQNLFADITGLVSNITQTFNGIPGQGFVPGLTDALFIKERSYSFYGQDSWRVRPNLTVNFGLRWEIVPAIDIANKRGTVPANGSLDLNPYGPLFQPNSGFTFNNLLANINSTTQLVPGGAANGNPFWNTKYHNFAPSIGIAWSPIERTVIRTGYSISYVRDTLTVLSNILSANASLHTGVAVNPAAGDPLAVLNPNVNQVLPPPPLVLPAPVYKNFLNGFSSTGASLGIAAFDQNLRVPYVQQWTLGIQRELARSTALEIRYVGNHGVGLYRAQDLDQINLTPALLSEFNTIADNVLNNHSAATPVLTAMGFPTSLLTSSTFKTPLQQGAAGQFWFLAQSNCTQRFLTNAGCAGLGNFPANFFIANPITGQARLFNNSYGSNYHALQVEVRKALSSGLQLQANYVFGKTLSNSGLNGSQSETDTDMDLRNPRYNYSRASFDIRHTFHAFGIYELPFGRHRRWVSNGILGRVLEGWQIGGLTTWRSGNPFTIASNYGTVNRSGNATSNPAVALGGLTDTQVCGAVGIYQNGGVPFYLPASYLVLGSKPGTTQGANPAVLGNPGAGSLGDKGLRNSCSGPSFSNIDANLVKKIHITERMTFDIRFEAFNVLNHTRFSVPAASATNTINNPNFGTLTVSSTSAPPREVQLNARFNF
jgi:Carboxypeptidase regulatory-like domain/TonB dependent receptor-like, beta-barrel